MAKYTIEEMEKKIDEFAASVDEQKTKNKELEEENAKLKKAAEEKKEEPKDEKDKEARRAAFKKHMKAATEEKDEAKKAEHLKEAAKNYRAEDEEEKKEDEEKEALKAQLTILTGELSKPRLTTLTAAYTGKVKPEVLTAYQANWSKMNISQLDEEIAKISVFAGAITKNDKPAGIPLGYSTFQMPSSLSASKTNSDEYIASLEKKTDAELFA